MARRHGSKHGNVPGGRPMFRTRKQRKRLGAEQRARDAKRGVNNDKN